ncbi:MAG: HEPN domain-containing protein [Hyphomicrobiaceae bacterium]
MSEAVLYARAILEEAQILLAAKRAPGAVNRAYYAMFHAASCALRAIDPDFMDGKTHKTVLRRFAKLAGEDNTLPPDLGRLLRRAYDIRQTADYRESGTTLDIARQLVGDAERFVAAIEALLRARPL